MKTQGPLSENIKNLKTKTAERQTKHRTLPSERPCVTAHASPTPVNRGRPCSRGWAGSRMGLAYGAAKAAPKDSGRDFKICSQNP